MREVHARRSRADRINEERHHVGVQFVSDGDTLFIVLLCASLACVLVIVVDGWFVRPTRDPAATSTEEPWLPKVAAASPP